MLTTTRCVLTLATCATLLLAACDVVPAPPPPPVPSTTTAAPRSTTSTVPRSTTTSTSTVPRSTTTSTSTSTTSTSTTTTTTTVPVVSRVGTSSTRLTLDGAPWTPVGVNAYSLPTWWGRNAGCGTMYTDSQLDDFFSGLPTNALVRTWAWQGTMATDFTTGQRDWGPLDRVVRAAEHHGVLLVMSLTSQSGGCDDDHWKSYDWYAGGFRSQWPGDGYTKTSTPFDTYLTEIVTRYRTSPAVAMWEPVNEPEGAVCAPGFTGERCYGHLTCPDGASAASAMRAFFDEVGGRIHDLDPGRPVTTGSIGGAQCGWEGDRFDRIGASPGVDVTSFHDYTGLTSVPGELSDRLDRSAFLDKPLVVGEIGAPAGTGAGCDSPARRAAAFAPAVDDRLAAGAAAVLLWNHDLAATSSCDMTLLPGDPTLALLH